MEVSGESRASHTGCQPASATAYVTASSRAPPRSASTSTATVFVVLARFAWTFARSARACAIRRASSRRATSARRSSCVAACSSPAAYAARSPHSLGVTGRTARFFARSSE